MTPLPVPNPTHATAALTVIVAELCNCPNKGTRIELGHHYTNCDYVMWYEQTQKEAK